MASTAKTAHAVAIRGLVRLVVLLVVFGVGFQEAAEATCTPQGTLTPTLGLCMPNTGELNWATAINGNWQIIDNEFSGGATAAGTGTCATGFITVLNTLAAPTCGTTINGTLSFPGIVTSLNVHGTQNTGTYCSATTSVLCVKQIQSAAALYIERGTDTSPAGDFIQAENAASNANLFVVDVNGIVQTASVGLTALRTATGSGNCNTSTTGCGIVMNANTFNVSPLTTVAYSSLALCTTPAHCLAGVPNGGTFSITWSYFTNSNNPRVWVTHDATGTITGTWAADDPLDNDASPFSCPAGCGTVKKYLASDLTYFTPTADEQTIGMRFNDSWGYDHSALHYRALQVRAGNVKLPPADPSGKQMRRGDFRPMQAPAEWLRQNAVVNVQTGHLCPVTNAGC